MAEAETEIAAAAAVASQAAAAATASASTASSALQEAAVEPGAAAARASASPASPEAAVEPGAAAASASQASPASPEAAVEPGAAAATASASPASPEAAVEPAAAAAPSEAAAATATATQPACDNADARGSSKLGWEAAQAWLMALPLRRNVTRAEIDEWLQTNRRNLSNEVASVPRLHMYRYLEAQHKIIRRADQANDAQPPQLLEPPLRRFKRSDKWKPVWLWLENLDNDKVVRANEISRWLLANPDTTAELQATHSRDHLLRYIQKCHHIVLKKKNKQDHPRKEVSHVRHKIVTKGGLIRPQSEQGEPSNGLSRERVKQDLLQQNVGSASFYPSQEDVQSLGRLHSSNLSTLELHPSNVLPKKKSWPSSLIDSNMQNDTGREVHDDIGQTKQLHVFPEDGNLSERMPGSSGSKQLTEKELAMKKYELLSDLQILLEDLVKKSQSQRINYTPDISALAQEEKLIFSSIDNSTRQLSVNSRRVRSRRRRSSTSSLAADAHHSETKRKRVSKEIVEKSVIAWTRQEALEASQSLEEATMRRTKINIAKCMQDREVGGALGSVACQFKNVGSHKRSWASVLRGWDSLDRQFLGPAIALEQKAYASWAPSWCAYTSNVAIVQPFGRMDQGIQKVLDVRFHPGGLPQLVCSCNAAPNELLLYSLINGRARELSGHNCQIQAVEYAASGSLIVSCASNILKVWDSSTATCLHTLGSERLGDNVSGHRKKISALAVNPFQPCLVATSGGKGDAQLLLWNALTGSLVSNLNSSLREKEPDLPPMDAIDFCNNHHNLLICGSDAANGGPAVVQLWDVDSLKDCTTFAANESYITCLKTNRQGNLLLTGSGDGSIGLFDIRTCGAISRLPLGVSCEVTSVSFSCCGTYFQGSSTANNTIVWDTRMMSMKPGTPSLAYPPQLAKADFRSTRALHCLSHGKPMPTAENACQLPGFVDEGDQGVNDARWFLYSPILVTASGNGSIAMWDMSLGQPCIRHMKSHSRCINSVAVAPDDVFICSGGDDQKVVIYQDFSRGSRRHWRLTHPLSDKLHFATRLND